MAAPAILDDLRDRVQRLQSGPPVAPAWPVHEALSGLLTIRPGAVVGTDSSTLTSLLLAAPTQDGQWCVVVGSRDFGAEAARELGVDLARVLLVPDPGPHWLEVLAALIDTVTLVVLVDPPLVRAADAQRLVARMRHRSAALVVRGGGWSRRTVDVGLRDVVWSGPDHGRGRLRSRQATVHVGRPGEPGRTRRLWLPDADLRVRPVETRQGVTPLRLVEGVA